MKHTLKKIISMVLAITISLVVSVPAFAATKQENAPFIVASSPLTGVTKCVKTSSGFDLYLSNADAKSVVSIGGLTSPILGLIPNLGASMAASLLVAGVLYEIYHENHGHGVVINFVYVVNHWVILNVEQQPMPMR